MCTLSIITRSRDYLFAVNRDERIARGAGEPPEIHHLNGTMAMYPSDGAGGTWIAVNEYGITLALLNRNDTVPRALCSSKVRSRGEVIPKLASAASLTDLQAEFGALRLEGISPFRLVAAFPSEQEIWEWRWDSTQLEYQVHEWKPRHWFSSSLSDEQAGSLRGAACRDAQQELDAGSVQWLQRLHASHVGGPGPFSLCVHRDDVKTLSYSEVVVTAGHIQIGHSRGSPCSMPQIHSTEIPRADCADSGVGSLNRSAI